MYRLTHTHSETRHTMYVFFVLFHFAFNDLTERLIVTRQKRKSRYSFDRFASRRMHQIW